MTGDPKREISLGIDAPFFKKTGIRQIRKYSFNQFQFPACQTCNSEFSELETEVNIIFQKIFNKEYLNNKSIDRLLDWFDKVRIGLWLGNILLDELTELISPNFYIKDRIAKKDRCLLIYELDKPENKGVQFFGFNSPGFQFIPSCFTLRVNNLSFFNISFDFLFSKNIGFPYPKNFRYDYQNKIINAQIHSGLNKISLPLINQKFIKASTSLYQPIFPKSVFIPEGMINIYDNNDYVIKNTLDFSKGKGDIFYFENGIKKLNDFTEIKLMNDEIIYDSYSFPRIITKQTLKTLESLLRVKPYLFFDYEKKKELEIKRSIILHNHKNFMNNL